MHHRAPLLGEAVGSRENALDLIRLAAALAVMVSHAWPIAKGPGTPEPLQALTGHTLGTLAVMVFFGVSGFLITLSYLRVPQLGQFAAKRARRVLPGLLVCVVLTAFVMGPLVTSMPLRAYLSDYDTWNFVVVNGSVLGFRGSLPGVFESNPFPAAAGSIWTLSHEIACYAGIAILGASGLLARPVCASIVLLLGLSVALALPASGLAVPGRLLLFAGLAVPFAIGALFCLFRDRIRLSVWTALALAALAAAASDTYAYEPILALALVYATLTVGFWPGIGSRTAWLRHDYSYGVYIYAFPVQGLVISLAGPMSPWMNLALALPGTMVLAALSWHLVERPMIRTGRTMARRPVTRYPASLSRNGLDRARDH